ncbi:MAG: hypothetical protein LBS06_00475 [Treponema sp.]|jgi:hypothetical protein|nr:hypothetical protein [Treponema sp.]
MLNRSGTTAILILILVFSGFPLFGEKLDPFVMPSARASAMGGRHAALADDLYSIFSNPAGFIGVKEEFSAAELTLSSYGPIFEILDLVQENFDSLDDLDISGIVGRGGFAAGFDVGGPIAIGWVGRGLGLGVFSHFSTNAVVSGATIRPVTSSDILMAGGYSFRVLNKGNSVLDLGFLGKGFFRISTESDAPIIDVGGLFDDPLNVPLKTALGMGVDLGIKYTYAETFSAALVCFDPYSPAMVTSYHSASGFFDGDNSSDTDYAVVKPRLDIGFKYRIHSTFLDKYISDFVVLADYHDFLDLAALIPRNPLLNVGLGIELKVLEALSFRVGIYDALPSAGFGLDLKLMQLDCSIYGKELGLDPGIHPVYGLDLGLLFRY